MQGDFCRNEAGGLVTFLHLGHFTKFYLVSFFDRNYVWCLAIRTSDSRKVLKVGISITFF